MLAPVGKFKPSDRSTQAVDIIRNRVDCLGVAEPEISRQGDNIVVDLPGVKDRDKARRIVGRTAELRFRPVLAELPPARRRRADHLDHDDHGAGSSTTVAGATTTTTVPTTTTTTPSAHDAAAKAAVASCDPTQLAALLRPDGPDHDSSPTTSARRASCCRSTRARGRAGSTSGRRAHRQATSTARQRVRAGQGYTVDMTLKDTGLTEVQRARRRVVPEDLAGEPGRDRARRRRAVAPAFQRADVPAVTVADRGGASGSTEAVGPRDDHQLRRAARCSSSSSPSENVSPTLGQRPARRRDRGGHHRPAARRALHARLLPAARRGRRSPASLVSARAHVLADLLPRAARSGSRSRSPA